MFHCPSETVPSSSSPKVAPNKGIPGEPSLLNFIQQRSLKHSQIGNLDKKLGWSLARHAASFLRPETIQLLQSVQKIEIFLTKDLFVGTPQINKRLPQVSISCCAHNRRRLIPKGKDLPWEKHYQSHLSLDNVTLAPQRFGQRESIRRHLYKR